MSARASTVEPEPKVLDDNRLRVVLDLSQRLRAFEAEFGFATSELEAALASGRVRETAEIAEWLIGYRTLNAVLGASRPAPAE